MASRGRQRNENFFRQAGSSAADAEKKVQRAFQRCAESGVLNLSEQGLVGDLPASVYGFQEASHAENWWEQYPVTKIDVSHNSLERIPAEIARLADCTFFVALSNRLRALPEELFAELPLKQLNVRQNLLEALPLGHAIARAELLVELSLSENQLTALPDEIFSLPNLEVLEVAGNGVSRLPEDPRCWKCTRLRRLDLSKNRLGPGLSRGLAQCGTLREILMASNVLQDVGHLFDIPSGHGWSSSLVFIDLSNNQLGPQFKLAGANALDTLNVSGNRVAELELGSSFPSLGTLLAGTNQLAECPQALLPSSAPKLATLDLSNNNLTTVPPELGLSQALKRIALEGNALRSIRPDLLRGGAEKIKAYLRTRIQGAAATTEVQEAASADLLVELRTAAATHELSMASRGLSALPKMPPELRALRLPNNNLTADALATGLGFGEGDGLTDHLRILDVSKNSLGRSARSEALLPQLLGRCPTLQDLDLSLNKLSSVGTAPMWSELARSKHRALVRVDLSGNTMSAFPSDLLMACPMLDEVRLKQNQVISLDAAAALTPTAGVLEAPVSLSILDLEGNGLAEAPAWLPSVFPRLRTLLLANNNIGPTMPPELGFWESLQAVSLVGNPLRGIRQSLISTGWPAVAAHLRDRLPAGAPRSIRPPSPDLATPGKQAGADAARRPPSSASGVNSLRGSSARTNGSTSNGYRDAAPDARPGVAGPVPAHSTPGEAYRARSPGLDARLTRLRADVAALEEELAQPGLSRAKHSSVTHSLRMKRAEQLRAERELRRMAEVADAAAAGEPLR